MDIYGVLDVSFLFMAIISLYFFPSQDRRNLTVFWALSVSLSFVIFQTDYYEMWPALFTVICLYFGCKAKRSIVLLGYVVMLLALGFNFDHSFEYYSHVIYFTFLLQLWMGRDVNYRDIVSSISVNNKVSKKNNKAHS